MVKNKKRINKSHSANTIVFHPDTNIGNSSAEADDEFLFECFVDHPALSSLSDLKSSKLFASGRTGIGKTAILRMIAKGNKNVSEVELADLALGYVANSDIIQFLSALDVDLDLFFQALWKHIFCIEFIRMRFKVKNSAQSSNIFISIENFFKKDERSVSALKYLKNWESKFWITMDENIKEITRKIEESIDAQLSAEIELFKGRSGYARTLSTEKKSALVARAKKIVDSELLADLGKVLELLSNYDIDKFSDGYFVIVDKIDEKWVDDSIRYRLIRALIECLRSFRKIQELKIIVAIRSDVLERVMQENTHHGFQREKYDDYFLRIIWTKDQLRKLVDNRINFLFKKKYSSENVFFYDVFDAKIGNKDTFDYMLERTLMRPRDIISYVNLCLSMSQGSNRVTQRTVKQAESEYSRLRLQALVHEWESAFPSLAIAFDILSGRARRFKADDLLTREFIDEFILEVDEKLQVENDPIVVQTKRYLKRGGSDIPLSVGRLLFSELYRIGAIGLKLAANDRFLFSHQDVPVVSPSSITPDTKIALHPMLYRALNIGDER